MKTNIIDITEQLLWINILILFVCAYKLPLAVSHGMVKGDHVWPQPYVQLYGVQYSKVQKMFSCLPTMVEVTCHKLITFYNL